MRPTRTARIAAVCSRAIDCGVHAVAGILRRRAEARADIEARHLGDIGRLDVIKGRVHARGHRLLIRALRGRGVDESADRACAAARRSGVPAAACGFTIGL